MRSMTWNQVLTWALAALVLTFVAIMGINMVIIPPLLIFAVVFTGLIVALQQWSTKRWLYIVTAVLATIVLVSNLPFILPDYGHPESFSTFVPAVVATIAALVAIVAAVAIAMGRAPDAARPVGLGAAALVGVLVLLSVAMTATAGDDAMADGDVVVVAENVEYPERLEAAVGNVAFFVENRDRVRHTFVIEGTDVKQELPAARDRRVEVNLTAGEYRFICDVPGHERMEGTLVVK
jgi:plastocyanin